MRLSTQQIFLSGLNSILEAQGKVSELQQQIASGKRVGTPADDPVGATRILALDQQISLLQQYNTNAIVAESRLRIEESTINGIKGAVQRVRELAIQAGDGALNLDDRQAIGVEVRQRLDQLTSLINTQDAEGQHLFSGFQSEIPPFAAQAGGGFAYQGDEGQLFIQVASNLNVAVSDSGKSLFANNDAALNFVAATGVGNGGTAAIDTQAVTNQNAFDAFHPEDATITFTVGGGGTSYTVTRVSDGTVISGGDSNAPLANVPYFPGGVIEFEGVHLELSGAPANGDTVAVTSQAPQKRDLLSSVEDLARSLDVLRDNPADAVRLQEVIADALIGLDNAQISISSTEAKIGARLNTIDDAINTNKNLELLAVDLRSQIEDLNLAEGISNLTQQSTILEATQATFVRVNNLSLFNFIR